MVEGNCLKESEIKKEEERGERLRLILEIIMEEEMEEVL